MNRPTLNRKNRYIETVKWGWVVPNQDGTYNVIDRVSAVIYPFCGQRKMLTCIWLIARGSLSLSRIRHQQNRKTRHDLLFAGVQQTTRPRSSTSGDECVPAVIKLKSGKKRRLVQNHLFFGLRCRCTRPPSTVKNSHYLSFKMEKIQ